MEWSVEFDRAVRVGDPRAVIEFVRTTVSEYGLQRIMEETTALPDAEQWALNECLWEGIAKQVGSGDDLYALGELLQNSPAYKGEAAIALRAAREKGCAAATAALADILLWLGHKDEGRELAREAIVRRLPNWQDAAAALAYDEVDANLTNESTIAALEDVLSVIDRDSSDDNRKAAEDYAVVLAKGLRSLGKIVDARTVLEREIGLGNVYAPIVLGNLLAEEFDDDDGAKLAYERGLQMGDGFSAYNLSTLYASQGDEVAARHYLMVAASMGDEWAIRRIDENEGSDPDDSTSK